MREAFLTVSSKAWLWEESRVHNQGQNPDHSGGTALGRFVLQLPWIKPILWSLQEIREAFKHDS